jgi:nucleoside-diphosphate-sugar epimerase
MRVLIIGGTGLISTPLTRQLLERGHEVTLYNRGKRAAPPRGARLLVGDRRRHGEFEAQVRGQPAFDCVIDMI